MAKILIVEDEGIVSMNTEMFLMAEGHNVIRTVNNGRDALRLLESVSPDLVLMDIVLRGSMSGIEATREINRRFPGVPVAYMTAHTDAATRREMDGTVCLGILYKPFDLSELEGIIQKCLGHDG